jgi:hypothetical protein
MMALYTKETFSKAISMERVFYTSKMVPKWKVFGSMENSSKNNTFSKMI